VRILSTSAPTRAGGERNWSPTPAELEKKGYDLKAVNPTAKAEGDTRTPAEILYVIESKGREIQQALALLRDHRNLNLQPGVPHGHQP
jgi:type I restriction enzyme M protein